MSPIKEVTRLFVTKHYSFNKQNKPNLNSSHYANASTDHLGTFRGSLGIRGAQFGDRHVVTSLFMSVCTAEI